MVMATSAGPLAGLRVIDLAGPPAVFATRELAELGADVVRVEPPAGDSVRRLQPFLHGEDGAERSLYHLHFNAGKRSVVLDLETDDGREALRRLAGGADVVVETERPGRMDELGVGFEALRAANPGLLYVSVTPFGQQGPLRDARGTDITAVAAAGLLYLNGYPEDPPVRPGAEQGFHMGALVAAATLLVALVGRERHPGHRGHRIDVSMQEAASMATLQTANANMYTWHGEVPRRQGLVNKAGGRSMFQCRDGGWLSFVVPLGAPALWQAYVDWMDEEGLAETYADPQWDDPAFRTLNAGVHAGVLDRLCAKYDRDDLFREGQRRRMLAMAVNTAADLVASEHLQARGFFNTVRHEHLGCELVDVGPPYRFSATPVRITSPAPKLGQHTDEVLAELRPVADADTPPASGGAAEAPVPPARLLEGLRVADFCWLIAGPSLTRVFADYGADVIKIESRTRVETIRAVGVQPNPAKVDIDTNGVFNDCNTSKRSITLNLNDPRGIELAKDLIRHSDIVTNNFTGDRMDRWGLGYDDLKKINPGIIMLTMPALGTTGPYKAFGSYGNGLIAFSGMNQNMGYEHRPPTGMAPLYSDFSAPYAAVAAVMAAVYHRERTGQGQFIELAQSDATVNLLGTDILEYTANGELPARRGNRSRDHAPHGVFQCAGEDRWCALSVETDADWRQLAGVIDRPDLASQPRLAASAGRLAHQDEIDAAITEWTSRRDAWAVAAAWQAAGLAAAVVENLEDMVKLYPQLPDRHLVDVERDGVVFRTHAQPARIDGTSASLAVSPRLGEHNDEVFRGLLGLPDDEVARLVDDRVIY